MSVLMKVIGWASGIDIGGIAKTFGSGYEAKQRALTDKLKITTEAATEIVVEDIKADQRYANMQRELALADRAHWSTRWIRPAASALVILYFGCMVLWAIGLIPTQPKPLPSPWDYLAVGILAAIFALRPFEKNKRVDVIAKAQSK